MILSPFLSEMDGLIEQYALKSQQKDYARCCPIFHYFSVSTADVELALVSRELLGCTVLRFQFEIGGPFC